MAPTIIYTLSLHDALPIYQPGRGNAAPDQGARRRNRDGRLWHRSEEHTSELQSHVNIVCRLLLEKKNHSNLQILTQVSNSNYFIYTSCYIYKIKKLFIIIY